MPTYSKLLGLVLILLGIISWVATGAEHFTALIPAFFGLIFYGLGYLAEKSESMRKHSMHVALLLALIGIAGSFGGLIDLFGSLGGRELERAAATYSQAAMAIFCIGFLILGIRSFIKARSEMQS